MVRHVLRITKPLVMVAFVPLIVSASILTLAEGRLGGEDVLNSYSGLADRVAFGGSTRGSEVHTGLEPDPTIAWMQDLRTGRKIKLLDIASGQIGRLAMSPSGDSVAVQIYVRQGELSANRRLIVLNAEGRELASFDQSRDFCWSSDSQFLAYTTSISDAGEARSTGTWIYDQKMKTTRNILSNGDFVAWSPIDNSLFIWSYSSGVNVLRYDPGTQRMMAINRRGIFLSPTGRYYHTQIPRFNEGSVEVDDVQSNQPILRQRPRISSILSNSRIVGWASEGDILILEVFNQGPITEAYPQGRVDTVLYDVVHDTARVIEDDSVIGWQNGQAVVHDGGKFTKRSLQSLPLLPEQAKPPQPPAVMPKP